MLTAITFRDPSDDSFNESAVVSGHNSSMVLVKNLKCSALRILFSFPSGTIDNHGALLAAAQNGEAVARDQGGIIFYGDANGNPGIVNPDLLFK